MKFRNHRTLLATVACWLWIQGPAVFAASSVDEDAGNVAQRQPFAPTVGRSLFDQLFLDHEAGTGEYRIPWPFDEVVSDINGVLGTSVNGDANTALTSLIPLGRCINRAAASPDFFRYPRIVLAVDSEHEGAGLAGFPYLRDRLFVGFQEKANAIEVISYNDQVGRFEFQMVEDYGIGMEPKVSYVERANCTGCHQNEGPIFPRPPWQETENNGEVFDLMAGAVIGSGAEPPIFRGGDAAYIDGSTNRANKFALYQLFWQGICQAGSEHDRVRCRAGLFEMVIQNRLQQKNRILPLSRRISRYFLPQTIEAMENVWPDGLSILSSDIPNEDPIENGAMTHLRRATDLEQSRSLLIQWQPDNLVPMIEGLGELIPASSIRQLDVRLYRIATQSSNARVKLDGSCRLRVLKRSEEPEAEWGQSADVSAQCDFSNDSLSRSYQLLGDLIIEGGEIASLSVFSRLVLDTQSALLGLTHSGGRVALEQGDWVVRLELFDSRKQLHARLPGGGIAHSLEIRWPANGTSGSLFGDSRVVTATARLNVIPDSDILDAAFSQMIAQADRGNQAWFSPAPFHGRLMVDALIDAL